MEFLSQYFFRFPNKIDHKKKKLQGIFQFQYILFRTIKINNSI